MMTGAEAMRALSFAVALLMASGAAGGRSLEGIVQSGAIALCAHPNALPFARKQGGELPGFQIELGRAIAEKLGVRLAQNWIVNSYQIRRAGCDIVLDAIGGRGALIEFGLRPSRPYAQGGLVLAVREGDDAAASDPLGSGRRIAVQVGSVVSMVLDKRGVETTPFGYEDEMMEALFRRVVDGVAVTPASAGYHNHTHPTQRVRVIPAFDGEPELNWTISVGMLRPDEALQKEIDKALEALLADGTIARIYARYGIEFRPPR
jgi:polar amino acid transport system substrate-binding protein